MDSILLGVIGNYVRHKKSGWIFKVISHNVPASIEEGYTLKLVYGDIGTIRGVWISKNQLPISYEMYKPPKLKKILWEIQK